MPILAAAAVVLAAMLLAWAGIEVDHVIHTYEVQFYVAVFAVLFIAAAAGAARMHRVTHDRVPLRPQAPPLPKAIRAAPVLTAVAAPAADDAEPCEGPGCASKVDSDPWTARLHTEEHDHKFCSRACAEAWHDARVPGVRR
jgi:hypothetical protein